MHSPTHLHNLSTPFCSCCWVFFLQLVQHYLSISGRHSRRAVLLRLHTDVQTKAISRNHVHSGLRPVHTWYKNIPISTNHASMHLLQSSLPHETITNQPQLKHIRTTCIRIQKATRVYVYHTQYFLIYTQQATQVHVELTAVH